MINPVISWQFQEEAQEYTDACALWELYLNTKAKVFDENKDSEKSLDSGKTKSGRKVRSNLLQYFLASSKCSS